MLKKLLIIDGLLVALVLFLAIQLHSDVKKFQDDNDLTILKKNATAKKEAAKQNDPEQLLVKVTQLKDKTKKLEQEVADLRVKLDGQKIISEREPLQKQLEKKLTEIEGTRKEIDKLQTEVKRKTEPDESNPAAAQPSSLTDYRIVVDKYVFSEERVMPKNDAKVEQIPELNPKPVLTGIILEGSESSAIVQDPSMPSPPSGRKVTRILKLGDDFKSYKVTQITESKMVLNYGNGKRVETIELFDKNKQRPNMATSTMAAPMPQIPATVRTVGDTGPPPAGVTPGVPPHTGPTPPAPMSPPGSQSGPPRPRVQPPPPSAAPPKPGVTGGPVRSIGSSPPPSGRIATPFGDIPKE